MEDGDDDFGDLYADVEVQATSAINIAPQFSKTQPVINEFGKQNSYNDRASVSIDNDAYEDDDDDDLDILLNSDDDSIKRSEGLKVTNARNRELDDDDDDNLYLRSQSAAYGSDLKGGIGCVSAAYWQQLGSRSMGPQTAQRFSLPRARNILDVNIDVFEHKPWKNPGVDITDYFNFGFNEDSWKVYCNQVDEYRHRGSVSGGTPPLEPAQLTEVDRRKGQAIQVEDSIFVRQSSMDIRRQLDRDSDAIQIKILDQEDTFVTKASNHGDGSGDDVTDHLSFSSASEDESVEEKCVETDIYPPKMRSDSENHELHQVVTDETIGTSNDTKESNLVEELFEAEKMPANHSKSFEDDACIVGRKAYAHDRCLTELTRSVKPDYYHSKDSNKSDDKRGLYKNRKHGERIYYERSSSPVYKNRTHKDLNLKTRHENDYIISKRTYEKSKSGEYMYHARHNNDFFSMSDEVRSTFRQRLHAFDPYSKENISYSKSEVPSDYYSERFSGYEDWDTERSGADMGRIVFRSSEEDEYYDERRRYIEDNRMMAGDYCHDEKGQKKGDNLYSRNKGEIDDLYLEPGYYDDTHVESFKSFTYNDRKRDDIGYTRWEFRGTERNKRRVCSLISELDNHFLKRDYVQSYGSRSSEESLINSFRWHGDMMPKSSFYRRHGSYEGQYFESFDREEDYMLDTDGRVDMRRKSCHWQSENELEDKIMFRHEDAKFCDHRNSFSFGKVSRRKRFVFKPDPDYDEELIDDPYLVYGSGYVKELTDGQLANGCGYHKQKNDVFNGNKFTKAYGKGRKRLQSGSRNSPLVVGKVKSSKKHKKPKRMDPDTCINDKVARAEETKAIDEGLDIEEGHILTEKVKVRPMMDKTRARVNVSHNENGKSGFDTTWILEAMAKMEKRRARFNEPIGIAKKDSDTPVKLTVVDQVQETGSNKQQRPARKRRWGASK